jgi:hypothetical protein
MKNLYEVLKPGMHSGGKELKVGDIIELIVNDSTKALCDFGRLKAVDAANQEESKKEEEDKKQEVPPKRIYKKRRK